MPHYEPTYYVKYPVIQVRPWGLLVYERTEWLTSRRKQPKPLITEKNHSTLNNSTGLVKAYTGQMTTSARKKLKRAIQLMVASAEEKEAPNYKTGSTFKFKVNFITLTLPAPQGKITDKQIKKEVLDNFIKRLKRKHKLNSYVWRAEKQKNGNLHFHMITDTWIHYEKIRNDWNSCLQKFNFIDQFELNNGHRNPNSTDVHAVWKVKNLTQYFIKYMSKDEKEGQVIDGKLWDCSKNLKTKRNCELILENETLAAWNKITAQEEIVMKIDPNFTLAFLTPKQFTQNITGQLLEAWQEYIRFVRTGSADPPGSG